MARDGTWEAHSAWWVDRFTDGADPEYEEQILPLVAELLAGRWRVLDLGTGEGQVARRVAGLHAGVRVFGVDPSRAQLAAAVKRASGPLYAAAAAEALPFPSAFFDAVVVSLVFEHVADVEAAIAEVSRVLAPGGRFVLLLNHPLLQAPGSGWVDDHILGEQYWRVGPYLPVATDEEEVDKGVRVTFVHRPLSAYVNALAQAGMVVVGMEEPPPPPGFLTRAEEYVHAATIPRLLVVTAERRPGPGEAAGTAERPSNTG
jgi:SAM-dependent methyltransferase